MLPVCLCSWNNHTEYVQDRDIDTRLCHSECNVLFDSFSLSIKTFVPAYSYLPVRDLVPAVSGSMYDIDESALIAFLVWSGFQGSQRSNSLVLGWNDFR